MKLNQSFINMHLIPLIEYHKQRVIAVYPKAHFSDGFIYDGLMKITSDRMNIYDGIESEYYAWMKAWDFIEKMMLKKLESE